jgi:arylsulfatase A-like enzyme
LSTSPLAHLYPPAEIPVGPTFMKRPVENASEFHRERADYYLGSERLVLNLDSGVEMEDCDLRTEAGWRSLASNYYGNVTLMDRAVGMIREALDESGKADNTAVVFTSEHGEMLGEHGLLEKRTLYQQSVKVPLVIRAPWLGDSERRIPGHASLIDLAPTLLDLLGERVPDHLDGESRLPVLKGESTLEDDDVFVQWNGRGDRDLDSKTVDRVMSASWRSVVSSDGWKLNTYAPPTDASSTISQTTLMSRSTSSTTPSTETASRTWRGESVRGSSPPATRRRCRRSRAPPAKVSRTPASFP